MASAIATTPKPRAGAIETLRTLTAGQWLFYVGFFLCAFASLIMRTTFDTIGPLPKNLVVQACCAIGAILFMAKVMLDARVSWRYLVAALLVVVSIVSFQVAGVWRVSLVFLMIAAGKDISLRALAGIVLVLQVVLLAITLPFAFDNRIYSFTVWRMVDDVWQPRLSYGFTHPNTLGEVFLTIALAWAALRFPRFHAADMIVYLAALAGAAILVQSRTASACIVLTAVLAAVAPFIMASSTRQRNAALAASIIVCLLAGFSLFMMVNFDPHIAWMNNIDQALSTRFSLAHRFFEVFPPHAFGRDLMAVKLDTLVQEAPDNAYARMVVKHGIVPTLVLGVFLLGTLFKGVRNRAWSICLMGLLVNAFVATMERYALDPTVNFFLIGCAAVLYGSNTSSGFPSLRTWARYTYYSSLRPRSYPKAITRWYRRATGRTLNLNDPRTYDEKMQWLKLYDSTPEKGRLSDKYLVRDWVAQRIGAQHLVPLLGVWEDADSIDFDALPQSFVLKATHGCGWNFVVRDKAELSADGIQRMRATLNHWLSLDYSFIEGLELQYQYCEPRIIAEQYFENRPGDLYDYKFFCFKGKVHCIGLIRGRMGNSEEMCFDADWNPLPCVYCTHPRMEQPLPRPAQLSQALRIAETLSADFAHVRVDLYMPDDEHVFFGEMTFTTLSGNSHWDPPEYNDIFGDLLDLSECPAWQEMHRERV